MKWAAARQLSVLWSALGLVGLYLLMWTYGPVIETKYWPVFDRHATPFEVTQLGPTRVQFALHLLKRRSCDFVSFSWYAGTPTGEFERVTFLPGNPDVTIGPTLPVGEQRVGPFIIQVPLILQQEPTFGVAVNDCGLPWNSSSIIGPFPPWFAKPDPNGGRQGFMTRGFSTTRLAARHTVDPSVVAVSHELVVPVAAGE